MPPPIGGVACHRMAHVGEVDPDLVGAASLQADFYEAKLIDSLQDPIAGYRGPSPRHHRHFLPVDWMSTDGRIDGTFGRIRAAQEKSKIQLKHCPCFYLLHEAALGLFSSGYNHEAAGVFVQPVDDARAEPPFFGQVGKLS